MGPGDEDLGPPAGAADLHHIDLQPVAFPHHFAPDLLRGGEIGVGGLPVAGDAQGDRAVAGVYPGNSAQKHLVLFGAEHVIDHAVLRLPHALDDHLAGGLGGDAAEVAGLDLNADHIPCLGGGEALAGLVQGDLGEGVGDLLHDLFFYKHADGLGDLVGLHKDVVGDALVVPFIGGDQGLGDLFQHIAFGDPLFLFNQGDGGKEFLAVQLVAFCGFRCFLSHDLDSPQ